MRSHSTILAIIFGFLFINLFYNSDRLILVLTFLSGICLFSERISVWIEKIWLNISKVLSYIIPNLILCIVFYFILTPFSILSKLFKSKTDFRFKNPSDTNFNITEKVYDKDSFERAW